MKNPQPENYAIDIEIKNIGVNSLGTPLACSAASNAWSRVFSSFGRRKYENPSNNEVVTLKFDDNTLFVEYTNQFFSLISDVKPHKETQIGWELKVPKLKIHAAIVSSREKEFKQIAVHNYVSVFLCEFFLAMNLAAPGSFSMDGRYFFIRIGDDVFPLRYSLNAINFWHLWNNKFNIDLISYLSIKDTCNWIKNLHISNKFIAENSIERAIFALLEYSRSIKNDHFSIINLSHLIESLYKIKPDLNILSTLKRRIPEVLKISNSELAQKLTDFYDFRSQFVHGSLDSLHFLADSIYDERVSKVENKILEVESFAFLIAYLTLRKFVENNWVELEFKESFEGKRQIANT